VRVLYVVHGFPPEEQAGTELLTAKVTGQMAELGHETFVFAASRHVPPGETKTLNGPAGRLLGVAVGADYSLEVVDPEIRRELERCLDELRPDVLHVQHLLFLSADVIEAAKARGIRVVVSVHDFWFQCPLIHPGPGDRHPFRGRWWGLACFWHHDRPGILGVASLARRGLLRSCVRLHLERSRVLRRQLEAADIVVAPSEFVRRSFERFGVRGGRLHVLPHGVEPRPTEPASPVSPVRFGFVGSLTPHKGVDVLCEAFSRTEGDSTLTLFGRCDDPMFFGRLTPYLGSRIRYEGEFEHERLADVYGQFNVLIVPSRVHESFSLVAAEAQAFGLPVIASRVGAIPELVDEGKNGLLVPPGDVRALAAAIVRASDPHEVDRLRLGVPAPMGLEEHAQRLDAVYRALVPRARGGRAPSSLGRGAGVGPRPVEAPASPGRAGR
jgi:glycosyltransferase involved in cell wall biosynthesis